MMKEYVSLEGDFATVCFSYSPNKIQAIKKIRGARFDRQTKNWRVPASSLPALKRVWCFSPNKIDYIVDEPRCSDAVERIKSNPFEASFKDITAGKPDAVIDLNETGLLITCTSGSVAEDLLRSFDGVIYCDDAESYYFPLPELKQLLAAFKKKGVFFAVHTDAGSKLMSSAEVRSRVIEEGMGAKLSEHDLQKSLLGPFLSSENSKLVLNRFPDALLKKMQLEEHSVEEIVSKAFGLGVSVWLTEELLPEADGVIPDYFALYVNDQQIFYLKKDEPYLSSQGKVALEDLQDAVDAFPQAVKTNGFLAFLETTKKRLKSLRAKKALLAAGDADLSSLNFSSKRLPDELFPHQRVAVKWMTSTPNAFLGDDMGLGKTVSVLAYFDALRGVNSDAFIIVICPRSLCINWYRESRKWVPKALMYALPQDKRTRIKQLTPMGTNGASGWDGFILNYEAARLEDVQPVLKGICRKRPVLLCLDESQRVKNPTAKTFQALESFAKYAKRRVLLSGTPTPREFSDIWAQMKLLDQGERLGMDYYKWLSGVAELGNDWSAVAVRSYKKEELKKEIGKVQEVLLRRRKEEVINLPEKMFSVRDIELSGSQAKKYKEITKELIVRISALGGASYTKEIDSILEEYLRAVQVASNPRLIDESWKGEPAKFLELDEIVEELTSNDQKLVVWTNFRKNVTELCERYKTHGARPFSGEVSTTDRDRFVKSFQDMNSSSRILVAVPAAGGVGITLTAANTCVYLDKTWNAEHWLQSIDRVHRIGQKGTVSVISLHGCRVDQFISYNLSRKEKMLKEVMGDAQTAKNKPTREELLNALR